MTTIADLDQRARALDPRASFIVQAPAGSGKTELLIQRYLVLLATVDAPEEIAAITFTRKSAAEMRKRILDALAAARNEPRPEEPHRAMTWDRARAALDRDAELGWQLELNSARLRVQTIDALCVSLTRQMPVLSSFGAQPENLDDASALYREAALATLELLEERHPAADDVAALLTHLDNHVETAIGLICAMLARRDQWLRAVARGLDRDSLEAALAHERSAALQLLESTFRPLLSTVPAPGGTVEEWLAFAGSLLTTAGTWRRRNAAALALEARPDGEDLRQLLRSIERLPPARYDEPQWNLLAALSRLLPVAVAQLRLVFAAHGQADFTEIAQAAITALGAPEEPSDLMLALDYRIRHLLVDEFQDTSYTQYELLERLTSGWQPDDGRTLFLVGDPMQSIYRFREAEVSLFLRARAEGLGSVSLEPLTLSANFRSQADIVDWVNAAFARVMPARENLAEGAVPYAASEATRLSEFGGSVRIHAFFNDDAAGEADQVVTCVREAQAADADGTIAVLVRNRAHLDAIVPALREAGLRFRAIEIETLALRQTVQDLLALTRALSHPGDRGAWLAVLRAPWCGLTLADLHALAAPVTSAAPASTAPKNVHDLFPETLAGRAAPPNLGIKTDNVLVIEALGDDERLARLSTDGRARALRAREVLERAMAQRSRGTLRDRVEAAWVALGGPAVVGDETDLEDAATFLDCLEANESAGELADPAGFESGLAKLFAQPDLHAAPGDVQLLTIHKAKGLEFDTVIVPGLGCTPRRADPSLLLWAERSGPDGRSQLLLAPIRATGGERDPIYRYLAHLHGVKEEHEDARLLYVAATRAKQRLHLLGDVRCEEDHGELHLKEPSARSLLEKLWPVVSDAFDEQMRFSPGAVASHAAAEVAIDQRLRRLPADWRAPAGALPLAAALPAPMRGAEESIEFSWAGETARHVGSVVHRWLQRIAEDGLQGWDVARVRKLEEGVRQQLAARGVAPAHLAEAAARVLAALDKAISDERGRWVLGPRRDARSEMRIGTLVDGRPALLVIDRLFSDDDGRRWIVDYKTSAHEGADREAFLDRERERYQEQLERYARALGGGAALGLYFPLLGGWREWEPGGA